MKSSKYIFNGQQFKVKPKVLRLAHEGGGCSDAISCYVTSAMTATKVTIDEVSQGRALRASTGWTYIPEFLTRIPFKVGDVIVAAAPMGRYATRDTAMDFTCSSQGAMHYAHLVVTKVGADVDWPPKGGKRSKHTIEVRRLDGGYCWEAYKEVNVDSRLFKLVQPTEE